MTATAVPNITPIDVTSSGASGNGVNVNGATFFYADPQPTGTGYIDPFLREQNSPSEIGVNTSIKGQVIMNTIAYDNKDPVNYTHDLAINTLTAANGKYQFNLDANQVANGPISLIKFQIFVSSMEFTDATSLGNFLSSTQPVFDMNAGPTKYRVDIASDNGSGSGDMKVLVPTTGIAGNDWLYMVAGFGVDAAGNGYASNDGFEEWSALSGVPPAPDSASALGLLGIALSGLEILRRKIKA
jgi:hypothetical protein